MTSLDLIAQKLDQVQAEQKHAAAKVSDIREGMYQPDTGLFARVKSIEDWAEDHEARDAELREHVIKIVSTMEPLTDDYKIRQSRRKWTDRILWLLVSMAIAGLLGVGYSLLTDGTENAERIDKIEKDLKKR